MDAMTAQLRNDRRETMRDARQHFHRVLEALRATDPENPKYERLHGTLNTFVVTWLTDTPIQIAAETGGQAALLWHDAPMGFGLTGLEDIHDAGGLESPPLPVVCLANAGRALERHHVDQWDLPEQQPVVDDPYVPGEDDLSPWGDSNDSVEELADELGVDLDLDLDQDQGAVQEGSE